MSDSENTHDTDAPLTAASGVSAEDVQADPNSYFTVA